MSSIDLNARTDPPAQYALTGDIGGTKTLLALAAGDELHYRRRFENDAYASVDAMLHDYLAGLPSTTRLARAVFALAGPVLGQTARLTNRPQWLLSSPALGARLGNIEVTLLNDFVAAAHGIATLRPADYVTLQHGDPVSAAPRLCVGPGTGLGVAAVLGHDVLASEGGHIAFAPTDRAQLALWRFLGGEHRRVTAEHVCSGRGLLDCYLHLSAQSGHERRPALEPADVTTLAYERGDPVALAALALFSRVLGAVVGDLALTFLARGGVYVAGGIAPKILTTLRQGDFVGAFNDKAEYTALNRSVPLYVVTEIDLGLRGAAWVAQKP